jgi:myosin protein heavy chain
LFARRLAAERDAAEKESRDKETKALNLMRQLDELRDKLAESDRIRTQQQRELDDLVSSKDDVGKNVSWDRYLLI